jgi:hypothetical protein
VAAFRGPAGSFLPAICLTVEWERKKGRVLEMMRRVRREKEKAGNLEVADEFSMLQLVRAGSQIIVYC